jgi:hypothetical protein
MAAAPTRFRYIRMTSEGNLVAWMYNTFDEAYKECLPQIFADWHVMLKHAAQNTLEGGEQLINVSFNEDVTHNNAAYVYEACWIQAVNPTLHTPFPSLNMPQVQHGY